jgi:hypothetical protein
MYFFRYLLVSVGRSISPVTVTVFTVALIVHQWSASITLSADCALNAIACENAQIGNDPSEWEITGLGDPNLQGFATDISVNRGETITFKINTSSTSYHIDIYRLGYYAGRGARRVASSFLPTVNPPQTQQPCMRDPTTALVDCGNWAPSAAWAVPATATSGVYIARLVRDDTSHIPEHASHIVFIVRDDSGHSDLLFQTSDLTWQAYNNYGGSNLYQGDGPAPAGRAYKVSYNRPFNNRASNSDAEQQGFLFGSEYPMIRFLEAHGYDVSYASGVDTERRGPAAIQQHKVFLSVGHDEYWSGQQRANVEAARNAGKSLAFFSGNEMFWKTRWEDSYRTLVCYKETHANAKIDPIPAPWTGTWRDPRFSPPADGGRPENAVMGQMFSIFNPSHESIVISSTEGKLRFWRNTGLDTLSPGQSAELPDGVLGFEWDEVWDNGFTPPGLIRLSTTTLAVDKRITDYGSNWGSGSATHHLTLYRHSSGALVFAAGTIQWAWGLDATHDIPGPAADERMRQATINLFADMNVQPTTLNGLMPASASLDQVAPTSNIQTPLGGAVVPACQLLPISGTATDSCCGLPAAVEVSVDDGATWFPAMGAANWTATWTPVAPGPATIKSRAVDDSGRIEDPVASVTVTVGTSPCFYTLWPNETTPVRTDSDVGGAVEVGVRFHSDIPGSITAIRYYKSAQNTGTHIVNLWTNDGTRLATAEVTADMSAGWRQVPLANPVAIAANTAYIASYHTDVGHFSIDNGYFSAKPVDRPPLHAPANGAAANAVYAFGASTFPSSSGLGNNYWVDVVFVPNAGGADTTPPAVSISAPSAGSTVSGPVTITATATDNESVAGVQFQIDGGNLGNEVVAPYSVMWDSNGVTNGPHTIRAIARDAAGNTTPASVTVTVANSAPPQTLLTTQVPGNPTTNSGASWELGIQISSDVPGQITALRFWKGPNEDQPHMGHVWSGTGQLLVTAQFTNETASGWQQQALSTPLTIVANTPYVVSVSTGPNGNFAMTVDGFATALTNLHLTAPAGGARYGQPGLFPDFAASNNYFRDIVFVPQ